MNRYEKVSQSLREHYAEFGHPSKGKPGRSQTDDERKRKGESLKRFYDAKGRVSDEYKKARNKANVYAYRARLRNAIPEDADLKLITKIYEACPDGYQVDHVIALANGGLHHQNNLQYLPRGENQRKGKNRAYDESLALSWRNYIPR